LTRYFMKFTPLFAAEVQLMTPPRHQPRGSGRIRSSFCYSADDVRCKRNRSFSPPSWRKDCRSCASPRSPAPASSSALFSNGDITPQSTFKTGINALKSDDIISSCGQRISCFYLCSQVYCAQTGTSALWDVTYEPDVEAMDRFLLISQQVVTFSSTRNVRNLNMRGAYTMYIVGIDIAKRKQFNRFLGILRLHLQGTTPSFWHSKTPHLLDSIPYCLTNGVQFTGTVLLCI